jgi:hypothetical protein
MTNDLTTSRALPPEAFADSGGDFIAGDLLLFDGKTGLWTAGQDKDEVPVGTKAVAIIDEMLKGFTRFDDGVPRTRLLPLWPVPDLRALRQSLGDLDEALWSRDAKGKSLDPWKAARRLPVILLDATCTGLIFTTSSHGGVKAVSILSRAVQMQRRNDADALPIISLASDSYLHSTKAFGKIFDPLFDIVDWTTHRAVEEMLKTDKPLSAPGAARRAESATAKAAEPEAPTPRAEGARKLRAALRNAPPRREGAAVRELTLREELSGEEATREAPWEDDNDRSPEAARQRIEAFRSKARRG